MTLSELGQSLKEAREAKGMSLADIAERIKVSARILRLIEEGEQRGLPHAVYSRGFITSFANLLEYDKKVLKEQLDILFPAEHLDDVQPIPLPVRSRGTVPGSLKRILVLVLFLLVLGGIGYGGWFVYDHYGPTLVELVKKPFSAISDPLPTEASPVASTGGASPAPPVAAAAPAVGIYSGTSQGETINLSGVNATRGGQSTSAEEAVAASASSSPHASEDAQADSEPQEDHDIIASQEDSPVQGSLPQEGNTVVINAKARCWVSYQVDGKQAQAFTMEPGSNHTMTYKDSLNLRLGNPSGVSLMVNGKPYEGSLRSDRALTLQFP